MAIRKTSRLSRAETQQGQVSTTTRRLSALLGVVLVVLALFAFIWLYVHQAHPNLTFFLPASPATSTASDPLAAAGITLSAPAQGQTPQLTRQQALVLVNQLEPEIAAQAGTVNAQYTLFSYTNANTSQPVFQAMPVWLIHYAHVSEPRPDTNADSHASRAQHDFYVFLDANSGRVLLAIWL